MGLGNPGPHSRGPNPQSPPWLPSCNLSGIAPNGGPGFTHKRSGMRYLAERSGRPHAEGSGDGHFGPAEKWHSCRKVSIQGEIMTALTARQRRPRAQKRMKGEAGFTLIDMLFVVALVGL